MRPDDFLFEVEQLLTANGYPTMDSATLKEAHARLHHPEVLKAILSGQLTPQIVAHQSIRAIESARGKGVSTNLPGAAPGGVSTDTPGTSPLGLMSNDGLLRMGTS